MNSMEQLQLNTVEEDILREMISIGLAKAADSFALLSKDRVMLHVPLIRLMPPESMGEVLPAGDRSDTVVQSDIKGDLSGKTFLIFSEGQSAKLAEVCIGPADNYDGNYPAMKRSLLLETSNILTGAIITQLAELLRVHLYGTPPAVVPYALRRSFNELVADLPSFKSVVFTVNTRFIDSGQLVEMPLVIVLDLDTVEKITHIIRRRMKTQPHQVLMRGTSSL